MRDALLYLGALGLLAVLMWRKKAPKTQAVLAFLVGLGLAGWAARFLSTAIGWVASLVGRLVAWVFGFSPSASATAFTAVLGLILLVILFLDLHPKKGKATNITVAAAFLLPLLWPAFRAGLESVAPGVTAGIGG